jgi:hypothetical protein
MSLCIQAYSIYENHIYRQTAVQPQQSFASIHIIYLICSSNVLHMERTYIYIATNSVHQQRSRCASTYPLQREESILNT